MAPHAQAARATALYAPCGDELSNWPRGRPADGSDDDYGSKADGALSQKAAALLDACDAEPDGDRRLALARRAYAAAPTAKNARRAYALALATSKRWGLLADLLGILGSIAFILIIRIGKWGRLLGPNVSKTW